MCQCKRTTEFPVETREWPDRSQCWCSVLVRIGKNDYRVERGLGGGGGGGVPCNRQVEGLSHEREDEGKLRPMPCEKSNIVVDLSWCLCRVCNWGCPYRTSLPFVSLLCDPSQTKVSGRFGMSRIG